MAPKSPMDLLRRVGRRMRNSMDAGIGWNAASVWAAVCESIYYKLVPGDKKNSIALRLLYAIAFTIMAALFTIAMETWFGVLEA